MHTYLYKYRERQLKHQVYGVGCVMRCPFCFTASLNLKGNTLFIQSSVVEPVQEISVSVALMWSL
jgi:adenine C2-methylase RlmN of 23S rRNA A2503 and tRNA A37